MITLRYLALSDQGIVILLIVSLYGIGEWSTEVYINSFTFVYLDEPYMVPLNGNVMMLLIILMVNVKSIC